MGSRRDYRGDNDLDYSARDPVLKNVSLMALRYYGRGVMKSALTSSSMAGKSDSEIYLDFGYIIIITDLERVGNVQKMSRSYSLIPLIEPLRPPGSQPLLTPVT